MQTAVPLLPTTMNYPAQNVKSQSWRQSGVENVYFCLPPETPWLEQCLQHRKRSKLVTWMYTYWMNDSPWVLSLYCDLLIFKNFMLWSVLLLVKQPLKLHRHHSLKGVKGTVMRVRTSWNLWLLKTSKFATLSFLIPVNSW
jgi:hypothetical protein